MRTTTSVVGVLLSVGLAALVGCAATGADDDPTVGYLASVPSEAGADEGESVKMPDPTPKQDQGGDDDDADAGGGTSGGGDAGAGGDAGGGGTGGGGTGGGGTGACAASNTCMGATNLGSVSGDTGADAKSAQGTGSKWFTVRVTENDSSLAAVKLWMKATLTSPAGANYDLYIYVPGSDTRECAKVTKSATSTTMSVESASVEFGEGGTFSNGSDDSRTVTIEVRHVSGTCAPTEQWTLNVFGNQK